MQSSENRNPTTIVSSRESKRVEKVQIQISNASFRGHSKCHIVSDNHVTMTQGREARSFDAC